MGPLIGVFDQRAAELINGKADASGFDGISVGGVLAWLMDCLDSGILSMEDLGVTRKPHWNLEGFDIVIDSRHNADLGMELIDAILQKKGLINFAEGVRKFARKVKRERGVRIIDTFVHTAFGRRGWMVPNQYWTPGALAPMAIMGKYYMFYGAEFFPPRVLGRICADRMKAELIIDNMGVCRFHRGWAEDMLPEIIESLYGMREQFLEMTAITASRINSRNSSIFWESERDLDFIMTFLKRRRDVEGDKDPQLQQWIEAFEKDKNEAALDWWCEMKKGIDETLRAFL
jgi:glyceraldehyde-3-phosphate dehydrogenase (ferredoxin)